MTDEELYDKMEAEFKEYRDTKLANGIKDNDLYGVAFRYELLDWVGSRLLEESENRQNEIDLLKSKEYPLEYLYQSWISTEDNTWDIFDEMLQYDAEGFGEGKQ